jgi:hypothetical protein
LSVTVALLNAPGLLKETQATISFAPVVLTAAVVPPEEPATSALATTAHVDEAPDIVTPGDVALLDRSLVMPRVQPVPTPAGVVNLAVHFPPEAEKFEGVADPEQLPPHVAEEIEDGVVPL